MRRHHILIPLAALLVVLPLILHGCSCGHDIDFHLQSWLDAAQQLRHGTLYPRWAVTPAWNAGEPRFIFYPPLSWMLGAILSLLFPIAALPALYTWIVLTAAGFAMYRCAVEFVSPNAALLAATIYLANPYMLFTAFERAAYGELLAAVWLPLLFLAAFRTRPTIHGIAIPIALLWLTNAPAAVMGSYAFAGIACFRVVQAMRTRMETSATRATITTPSPAKLIIIYILGTLLGLALPAFYLLPAAYERRYVQIAMAIIPNMRIQDNFLFGHTADTAHNVVLHTASVLAVTLLAVTLLVTLTLLVRNRPRTAAPKTVSPALLVAMVLLIAFLLTPLSLALWLHLPELKFLQFSWRLLAILATILGLAVALLCDRLPNSPRVPALTSMAAPVIALVLALVCIHLYRQGCDPDDMPIAIAQAFRSSHGVIPTDEYTPTHADNDFIRPNNPAYWLSDDPQAFAPHTTPNPGVSNPDFDGTFPAEQTVSYPVPHDLRFSTTKATFLILNLRDYPAWDVGEADSNLLSLTRPPHIHRDDGLVAIHLDYASDYWIRIRWHTSIDQWLGYLITLLALFALAASLRFGRHAI